jgi:hypothetical protein
MNKVVGSVANTLLSLNRLGRGNAALFLLLSFGAIGTEISLITHLVLAHTAALWYNGLNDLLDLEIDRSAYAKSPYRKVLLNGAMTARALWFWLILLLLASAVLLVVDVRANLWSVVLFAAGILCSVVYDMNSKYLARPSIALCILLDAVVGGPFYFYYASLAVAAAARPDVTVVIGAIGSLLLCGLYGNFIFAAKDLSTDAKRSTTLPMMLGSTVDASGAVRHSPASQGYLVLLFALIAVLAGYVASHRYWFALVFAGRFLVATVQLCSGKVTERGHRKLFVRLSNWEMALLLSLFVWRIGPVALVQLILVGLLTILANVAYYHDERANRVLMLQFARGSQA